MTPLCYILIQTQTESYAELKEFFKDGIPPEFDQGFVIPQRFLGLESQMAQRSVLPNKTILGVLMATDNGIQIKFGKLPGHLDDLLTIGEIERLPPPSSSYALPFLVGLATNYGKDKRAPGILIPDPLPKLSERRIIGLNDCYLRATIGALNGRTNRYEEIKDLF
jgi:hypothetical protein